MWRIYAIVVIVVIVLGGLGAAYFNWSQNRMAKLNQDIAEQTIRVEEQNGIIMGLGDRINSVQGAYSDYNRNVNVIRTESSQLSQQITNPEINNNASTQPRETEVIINGFTQNMFQQFEQISRDENIQGPVQ
jgi:hypothetical protein